MKAVNLKIVNDDPGGGTVYVDITPEGTGVYTIGIFIYKESSIFPYLKRSSYGVKFTRWYGLCQVQQEAETVFVSFFFPAFGSGDCHSGISIVDSWSRFELGADEHKISIKSLTFRPSGDIKGVEARGKSEDHLNVVVKPTDEKGLLKWYILLSDTRPGITLFLA